MDGLDTLAQALGITDKKDADWHTLAKVSAVNQDGTLTVYMGGSLNPTTVDAYCDAQAGDVVCVLISKGKARAIATRGGASLKPTIELLWTNPNPGTAFQDLAVTFADEFDAFVITSTAAADYGVLATEVIPAGITANIGAPYYSATGLYRTVTTTRTSATFSRGSSSNHVIPYYIWGVRY